MWGAALDHIREVEVVLADGTITRANETQNPDLYFVCDHPPLSYLAVFIFFPPRPFVVPEPRLVSLLNSCSILIQSLPQPFSILLPSSPPFYSTLEMAFG